MGTRTPCITPLVVGKAVPWKPLCLGTTWWRYQKFSKSLHRQGPALYPSCVMRRRSRSTVSYSFLWSRNTTKRGSWSILTSYWASFNSIISSSFPFLDLNPWRTSCNRRLARRQVFISASATFHRVSSRPIHHVSVVPFVISIRKVHPRSWVIFPVHHMCCIISTIHKHPWGGPQLLPGVRLPTPLFEVLRAEVGASAHSVWE